MEYLYVFAAFIFVTIIALILKSKRDKEAKVKKDKEHDLVIKEQIKTHSQIEARKKN